MGTRLVFHLFLFSLYSLVFLLLLSHQEPMMRSTPNEFNLYGKGTWDYVNNGDNIKQYWLDGAKRAKSFESVYTLGMRGFGDRMTITTSSISHLNFVLFCLVPLSQSTNIKLLEQVISDQTAILKSVYNGTDVQSIPQIWTLCESFHPYSAINSRGA